MKLLLCVIVLLISLAIVVGGLFSLTNIYRIGIMGNVVRIGDNVSCGDHSASGSGNVFANGMPITHAGARNTTGHGCYPPTVFIGAWSSSVFVNNQPVALLGKTRIQPHRCGKHSHSGVASSASPDVSIEE